MVSDRPAVYVMFGHSVLRASRLDSREPLAAACDRYDGSDDVEQLLGHRVEISSGPTRKYSPPSTV